MPGKIPASFLKVLTSHGRIVDQLVKNRVRALYVLTGSDTGKMAAIASRLIQYHSKRWMRLGKKELIGLYIYHDEFPEAEELKKAFERTIDAFKPVRFQFSVYEKSEKYLGMTFSFLVMDLTKDLKPNDVGRLVGIVEGGGLIIFLAPPWSTWDGLKTIFKVGLTTPQYPEPRHVFITWFKKQLLKHEGICIYDIDNNKLIKKLSFKPSSTGAKESIILPEEKLFPKVIYEHALTQDQVNVLKLMENLFEKPKKNEKTVIVLTADRGRGKSCSIGIGVVGLIHILRRVKPKPRILVTAPEPSNVQSLMMLAKKTLDSLDYRYEEVKREGNIIELRSEKFSIEYWEPINIPKIRGDIVVVDEAAGIHVPLLYKIWEAHDRIIFSSTIHGYEGAGRGFTVRFLKRIKSHQGTRLIEYEMVEPIRYGLNDPVEKWQFDTLLLDAEPAELSEEDLHAIEKKDLIYVKYEPGELFENEKELRELFGIYVLAHYRNEPDDLGMLADAPHHLIRAVKTKTGKIVCAMQIAEEGPIDEATAQELLKGSKIPGNIIPDRFLKHIRIIDFASTRGWRIVRIATHPSVQGKGIGSWALEKLVEEARERGLDWVGSGFGVSEELLRFWVRNGFVPLHISPDRNPVSGEYTILVLKPIRGKTSEMVARAREEFKHKLLNSLPVNYREMEPEIAHIFLSSEPFYDIDLTKLLTSIQLDRLWTYCLGPMTFEAAADLMFTLARTHWLLPPEKRPRLTRLMELILITKGLQGLTWDEASSILKSNPKHLQKEAHEIACTYFSHITGVSKDIYKPGVRIQQSPTASNSLQ
uniref:tRNA(Met) cytidine acetyltransferase TmcA n=1 Tax=Thermosphaera aggregans TaxID=54254 RepID=A0A7C2BLG1_9CREN